MPSSSRPAGAGALPLADAYVQYLNCTDRRDGDSCGRCANCVQIAQLAHPDLHFVFPVNRQGKKSGEAVRSDEFLPLWRSLFAETGRIFRPPAVVRPPRSGPHAAGHDLRARGRRGDPQTLVQELRIRLQECDPVAAGNP